jgi:SAM-dependent methyltransferase
MDFDEYASDYDRALGRGIAVSGENKEYFARERVAWLKLRLGELGLRPRSVIDFGCGTGSAMPFLRDLLGAERVLGVDDSAVSLEIAARHDPAARFVKLEAFQPDGSADLVFCNGVFHHVPPPHRPVTVETIRRALRPGGVFALWENNPWNPGTRYVMWRIPFDRDAVPISAPAASALLRDGGFEVLRLDFRFVFPRALSWLRRLEPAVASLPFGAQYQVLARTKTSPSSAGTSP